MQFQINLEAGQRVRQQTGGALFVLVSTGAATSVEITLYNGSHPLEEIRTATRGFKARVPGRFSHVDLLAAVACTLEVVISDGAVDFDFMSGSVVSVIASTPLPVSNDRGGPGNPVNVTAVTVSDAPATSATNNAAVTCTAVAAVVAAANVNRRELRLSNIGADPVAIGPAGITWATRCLVLYPGDFWVETKGANLAWSGICDVANTASVTAQEVLA